MATQVRATIVAAVYNKALVLSRSSRRNLPAGKLIQLQTKEADKMETFILFAHNLWSAPLNAMWIIALLLNLLGSSAVVCTRGERRRGKKRRGRERERERKDERERGREREGGRERERERKKERERD